MDLNTFLQDDSYGGGSWADDDIDLNTVGIPTKTTAGGGQGFSGGANPLDPAFGGFDSAPRRDREEYPIPDAPPYRARINNLPWDTTEEAIGEWFEDYLQTSGAVTRVSAPKDFVDPTRLKGFGFITFDTREQLEKSLSLNATEFEGRRVFVAVAAPEKSSGFGGRRDGEDVDLDWGSARGSGLPSRGDRGDRGDRPPRREEPDLDWGMARGSGYREPKPKREEPNLDWTSARGSGVPSREPREPREPRGERSERPKREEPDLDWGSARGSAFQPRPDRKPKREEKEFDWSSARGSGLPSGRSFTSTKKVTEVDTVDSWSRGQQLPPRSTSNRAKKQEPQPTAKPAVVKSSFAVLAGDDDGDDESEEEEKQQDESTGLEEATADLSVRD